MSLKRRAALEDGETVLITAAAGAAGLAAVDLAKNVFNCQVIGAAGSDEKCQLVKSYGADMAINYKTHNIRDEVLGSYPNGADVIYDTVGGSIFKDCLRCIAFEGRLLVVGFASGDIPKIPANHLLVKNASAVGVYWGSYMYKDRDTFMWSVSEIMKYFQQGKIKPHVSAEFDLVQVNNAFDFIKSRKSTGKVVITM